MTVPVWRLIQDGAGSPAWNMAVDEALLRLATDKSAPVLRLYAWETGGNPPVSLGYFQEAAVAGERPFVRRYTGGGLVDHAHDVTYTVVVPRAHPLGVLSTSDSYSKIHEAVAAAARAVGLDAALAPSCDEEENAACFQRAVKFDVIHAGKKIAGAAQRRTRAGMLQQGSVLLPDPAKNDAFRAALPAAFASALGAVLLPDALGFLEKQMAADLARDRYATDGWNRQR